MSAPPKPKDDPALQNIKDIVHRRLIVKLFSADAIKWNDDLTFESLHECIDGMQRELQALKAAKLAKILNSTPLAIENEGKYGVLREYGIPLNDHTIQAIIRDLHTLNNDLTDGSDLFSVQSNNDKNRKLLSVPRSGTL